MNVEYIKNSFNNSFNNSIKKVGDFLDKDEIKFNFKKKISFEERCKQSKAIIEKYPNRLPVICNVSNKLPDLDRHKYLIPTDIKSSTFFYIIRKRLNINEKKSMYFFVNSKALIGNVFMEEVYRKYKDADGFLYIYVCAENTFG
tara:strand:+ start:135 stop:566 length:432 start_codon:yes stop_codon:yes gene_type:complete